MKNFFKAFRKYLMILFILYFVTASLTSNYSGDGIRRGLDICFKSLIPSLFPFMVISGFIANSEYKSYFSKAFGFIGEKIFRCPRNYSFILLFSLIGGYPIGAKMLGEAVKSGEMSELQAEKMLCYCVNCSPAFLMGGVGGGLFSDYRVGLIIYISQVCSAAIIANFLRRKNQTVNSKINSEHSPFGAAIVKSISSSTLSMVNICGFVLAFTAFTDVILNNKFVLKAFDFVYGNFFRKFVSSDFLKTLLVGMTEVTTGVFSCENPPFSYIPLIAFLTAFGGISVYFQAASCIGNIDISFRPFIISRFANGFYSALITRILIKHFLPQTMETYSPLTDQIYINPNSVIYTLCMLCMITTILLSKDEYGHKLC